MAAGAGTGVGGEAEGVEDGAEREDGHEEEGEMEVAELGEGGGVAVGVGDQTQGDGSDGDADPDAELHDGAEKAVGAAHAARRDLGVGEGGHAGELHGAAGAVEKEDGEDEGGRGGGAERGAEDHREGGEDAVDDEDATEAEAAQDLDDEGLHAEVAAEEREQIEAGVEGVEAEDDLEHQGQQERQHRDGDAEGAAAKDGEGEGLELGGLEIDEGGGGLAAGGEDGEEAAAEAEGEDGGGKLPVHALCAELLHGVDGSAGGEAGEEEGEPVEGMLLVGADVLDPQQGEGEGEQSKGEIDEEDPVPAGVGGDEAAERGTEDEGGEAGPGDVGDGLGELVFGRVAQDDEASDGDHHGSTEALEDAHQGELGEGVGDAAEERGEGEDGDGGGEDGAGAETVGHPAADGDQDGEGEEVRGHADVETDGADVEAARHLGQRGGDNGAVEVFHEQGPRDQGGDEERGATVLHGSILRGNGAIPTLAESGGRGGWRVCCRERAFTLARQMTSLFPCDVAAAFVFSAACRHSGVMAARTSGATSFVQALSGFVPERTCSERSQPARNGELLDRPLPSSAGSCWRIFDCMA